MENQKDVNITLTADAIEKLNGSPIVVEMHTTEHNAPRLNEKIKFKQNTTIDSVLEYVSKRTFKEKVQEETGIILYCLDATKPSIAFIENPNDELSTSLLAVLKTNPDFNDFQINTQRHFSQKALMNLIRTHAHCFQNIQDVKDLISNLQNFTAKYEQFVESNDDRRGNTKDLVTTAIKSSIGDLANELKLSMPLFIGTKKVDFVVQIEIEKGANNLPEFGFYSLDVEMQKREAAENIILTAKETLEKTFVCLEVEKDKSTSNNAF